MRALRGWGSGLGCGLAVLLLLAGLFMLWRGRVRITVRPATASVALYEIVPSSETVEGESLALYEPATGCYLGAYIDLDPGLEESFKDETARVRKRFEEFEKHVGRQHATYFFYLGYGRPLPLDWVRRLATGGRIVHIALEPHEGLEQVQLDDYLLKLAEDLAASEAPILLRFASEMNGPWVPYHGDPERYIEKWRLVARVMRERAPNVALVWCPYVMPRRLIPAYYPGDDYVDWVGINFYSVTYYNQDRRYPGAQDHPGDLLDWFYHRYGQTKPIMICEYAAANFSALENERTESFAKESILALYRSLPTRYPRVKGVTYFSSNNLLLKHRLNNDYSLVAHPGVMEAYQEGIADGHFLSSISGSPSVAYRPLQDGSAVGRDVRLRVDAKVPGRVGRVEVLVAGKRLAVLDYPQQTELTLHGLDEDEPWVEARAFDRTGALVATQRLRLKLQPEQTLAED
jgi:hypothetical protein